MTRRPWSLEPDRAAHVRRLHARVPVVDAHCDSIRATILGDIRYNPPPAGVEARPRRLTEAADTGHLDFPRALEGGLSAGIFNLLVPRPKGRPMVASILKAYHQIRTDLADGAHLALLATSVADVERAHRERRLAVILGVEGAEGIEADLDLLHAYHRLGVRTVGLTWMWRNELADGTMEDGGRDLTPFGRAVVREMNELRLLVDAAHAPPRAFFHTLELSERPVICSHTSCQALVKRFDGQPRARYLSDDQMRALADRGGVMGIFFSADRELDDPTADVRDLARFFTHAAEVAGPQHVGIGSDFDGGFPPAGLEDVRGLPNLTSALIDEGFSEEELIGILGGNWLRVFREVWGG